MKKLLKWLKPHIFLFLIICAFVIIIPATYSFVPQFIKYVIDNLLSNVESTNTLPLFILDFFNNIKSNSVFECVVCVAVSLILYQLCRGGLMFFNGVFKGIIQENISLDMRNELYCHIQDLSYSYHNGVDSGDLIQRCTSDIDTIKQFIGTQLTDILYIITSVVSGAIQMSTINIGIFWISLITMPIIFIGSYIFHKFVRKSFENIEELEGKMTTTLEQNINGTRIVKAFSQERNEIEKFDEKNKTYRDAYLKFNKGAAYYWGFSDGMATLQYLITIIYCISLSEKGLLSTGDIVACLSYVGLLIYPIRGLARIIGNFGKSVVAAKRIDEILSVEDEYVNATGTLKPEIKGSIEFKNLSFKFEDANMPLLHDVSFNIKQGETVAIVGKTGCGKSTIIHLLERLLEYTEGSILIDGVELKDIDKRYIRKNIGLVLQDPFLYNKTIYENIGIATKNVTEDDIYNAAKMASIHEDILNFDKKYETLVGEKGATVSGGQKQRIAMARMLILDTPIVIFDDSLSAVDTLTDKKIRKALKENKKNTTKIIITHRITTAMQSDKIIVLDDGTVESIGTHEELLNVSPLYKSLWAIQGNVEEAFSKTVKEDLNNE